MICATPPDIDKTAEGWTLIKKVVHEDGTGYSQWDDGKIQLTEQEKIRNEVLKMKDEGII